MLSGGAKRRSRSTQGAQSKNATLRRSWGRLLARLFEMKSLRATTCKATSA